MRLLPSIRYKIILPYFVLTVATAVMGILIVIRLLSTTIDDRFTSQILEAGRVVSDGLVREERRQINTLRLMTQTDGVAEAVLREDEVALRELLEVHAYSANLDSVIVLDAAGKRLMQLNAVREIDPEVIDDYRFSSGGNLANLPMVSPILSGFFDEQGDKYSGLVEAENTYILYTSAPVYRYAEGSALPETVGVILTGVTLDRLLDSLKSEALADIVVYNAPGKPIGSTIIDWHEPEQYEELTLGEALYEEAASSPDRTPLEELQILTLFERDFRAAYAPMVVRNRPIAVFGVLLPSSLVVSPISTSRNTFILIFSLSSVLVVVVGYVIAQRILRPVLKLAELAQRIAEGDLTQRADIHTNDELGVLADTFDHMTGRLRASLSELEEENAKTTAILQGIADGVLVVSPGGEIILRNPAAVEMLEVNGRFDPTPLEAVLASKDAQRSPTRITVGKRTLSLSIAPVTTPENSFIGDVLVLRDITREAIAERTKDNFLNQIGHELRTPLTSLQAFAEILVERGASLKPDTFKKATGTIYTQTQTLAHMIDDLIDRTALHDSSVELKLSRIKLGELVGEAVEGWQEAFSQANITPVVEDNSRDLAINADRRRLRRALDALFKNACDFSPDGGRLVVTLGLVEGQARLSIADSGVGISEEDLPHIFDEFYRGSPVDSEDQPIDVRGMGQGLSMVKLIVEAHGGKVDLKSAVGKGTTVTLYFPAAGDADLA